MMRHLQMPRLIIWSDKIMSKAQNGDASMDAIILIIPQISGMI
jgi:hypothetical protein